LIEYCLGDEKLDNRWLRFQQDRLGSCSAKISAQSSRWQFIPGVAPKRYGELLASQRTLRICPPSKVYGFLMLGILGAASNGRLNRKENVFAQGVRALFVGSRATEIFQHSSRILAMRLTKIRHCHRVMLLWHGDPKSDRDIGG